MNFLSKTGAFLMPLLTCFLGGCSTTENVSNDPAYVGTYATTKTYVAVKDLVVDRWPDSPGEPTISWCLLDPDNLVDKVRYANINLGGKWNLSADKFTLKKGSEVRFTKGIKEFTGTTTSIMIYGTLFDKDENEVEVVLNFISEGDFFTGPDGRQSGLWIFTGPDPKCLKPAP